MVQGDEQVGRPGAPLDDPLIVRVTDAEGTPVTGQSVTWSVNAGGGAIDPVTMNAATVGPNVAATIAIVTTTRGRVIGTMPAAHSAIGTSMSQEKA